MIIELSHIYKSYYNGKMEVPVLKDISLNIDKGEYVAIMGASGSGKSTLMNIIGCLDRPTKGDYLFGGSNIFDYNDRNLSDLRLNKIGFVFQSFHLLPGQSALNNVMLPLQYAGIPKKERKELAFQVLDKVGLAERVHFKPNQLSGGQCQRVAIARAMVNNPDIILADEPTGALDSKSGEQIMELFSQLNDDGVTVVMITHEAEIAEHAKRIIHIKDGQIIEPNMEVKPDEER